MVGFPLRKKQEPNLDEYGELVEARGTLVEHLDELRVRIMRALFFVVGGWTAGWFLEPYVYGHLDKLLRSALPKDIKYQDAFTNFADPFFLKFKLSFIIGLIIMAPFIINELWGFIRPALKSNEKKALRKVAPLSVFLFFCGTFFGYQILVPAFNWFLSFVNDFQSAALFQAPGTFVTFVLKMLLAFGLGFQLPIVVWFLANVGILSSDTLLKNWRVSLMVIIAGSAIITPSGDLFSLAMMSVPLAVLFMLSIVAIRITEKRKKKIEVEERFE